MAIALESAGTKLEHGAAISSAVPMPAAVTPGSSILILFLTANTTSAITAKAGWTTIALQQRAGNTSIPAIYIAWRLCDGTEGASVSVTHPNAASNSMITSWTGVDTVTPIDVAWNPNDNTPSTTAAAPSVTPATANVALLHFSSNNNNTHTSTPPATLGTWTELQDGAGTRSGAMSYLLNQPASATGIVTATWSGTAAGIAGMVVLRAASGTLNAAAALGGAGSLTVGADVTVFPGATLVGAGSVAADILNTTFPAVAMAGAGSLSAAALDTELPTTTMSGVGSLTIGGTVTRFGAVNLVGTGTLTPGSLVTTFPAVAIHGAGSLFVSGTVIPIVIAYTYIPEWLVTDAVLALLRAQLPGNIKVYDHHAPELGRDFPYVILYRVPGGEWFGPPLADPQSDMMIEYQIDVVGRRRDQAEALGTKVGQIIAGYVNGYLALPLNLPLGVSEYGRLKSDVPPGIEVEGTPPEQTYTYPGRYQVAVTPS